MFTIQFQGVITHATLTNSSDQITRQLAILYDVINVTHVPKLTVRTVDGVTTTLPLLGSSIDGSTRCYRLEGIVTFDLPPGLPSLYLDGVPRLTEVITGSGAPRTVLRNQTPHPDFHAYVILPRGAMTIGNWFPFKGRFGSNPAVSVPKTVVFSVATTDTVIMTVKATVNGVLRTDTVTIPPGATILISNNEREDEPLPHFLTYARFFDASTSVLAVQQTAEPCDITTALEEVPTCLGDSHLSVECSNTLYP